MKQRQQFNKRFYGKGIVSKLSFFNAYIGVNNIYRWRASLAPQAPKKIKRVYTQATCSNHVADRVIQCQERRRTIFID